MTNNAKIMTVWGQFGLVSSLTKKALCVLSRDIIATAKVNTAVVCVWKLWICRFFGSKWL